MNWIDYLGYAASASVLLTFCMSTMAPLRASAIASNVLFASFGAVAHIYPVFLLHLILLPVNIWRLVQMLRLAREAGVTEPGHIPIRSLLPFMASRALKEGEVLIKKDDRADHMYYLANGTAHIPEIDKLIQSGTVLGEIGIFAPDQKRTMTVVCVTNCEVYEISASKAKQLYVQDSAFAVSILQLVIARLIEDLRLLREAREPKDTDARC
jgi:CRP/FNR family transcriptional regulator, cyclic AMP receptor protein